jgi:hypothetical protein
MQDLVAALDGGLALECGGEMVHEGRQVGALAVRK